MKSNGLSQHKNTRAFEKLPTSRKPYKVTFLHALSVLTITFLSLFSRQTPTRSAYLSRKFNVFAVDWERISAYPCYLSSLSNTKLVSQCTAQVIMFVLRATMLMGSIVQTLSAALLVHYLYREPQQADHVCGPLAGGSHLRHDVQPFDQAAA